MSKTPTPETDKAEDSDPMVEGEWQWIVPSSFARRLERERDEARSELAIAKKQLEAVEGLMLDLDEKLQEERKHNAELYDEVARYDAL